MSYYDLDLSNRWQYDTWWHIEKLQAYYDRKGRGKLDIIGYLLEYRAPHGEDAEQMRQDLGQVAYAFLGAAGQARFFLGSRDIDWGDDETLKHSLSHVGNSARQKAYAALYSHNVVFDASADTFRIYDGQGQIFDRETQDGFRALIDDGFVEIDYKYEFNQGVCYRVGITSAGIDDKYGRVAA